jgi:hypothetical protein
MNFCVIHQPSPDPARSPFRVVEQPSRREVDWVNRFLDRERIRRVSPMRHSPGDLDQSPLRKASRSSSGR